MLQATLFSALSVLGLAAAAPVTSSKRWGSSMLSEMDFEIINLARNLESLELAYWNQALDNYTDADFSSAGYDGFRTYVELFRDQEIAHFTALNMAAGGGFTNCTYTFPGLSSIYDVIAMAQVVTSVGEGAFIGAEGNLTSPAARQMGASILGNEARQNSKLREEIKLDYFNAVNFDTPLTASQAYSLAEPFFECPSSNAPINFKLIPPIMANFTGTSKTHMPGDEVAVMWDANAFYLGDNVHIQFLGDMYSVAQPLKQSGSGMGTTTLPQGINGTAFLVATDYEAPGPIPDQYNYGIGYLVVA